MRILINIPFVYFIDLFYVIHPLYTNEKLAGRLSSIPVLSYTIKFPVVRSIQTPRCPAHMVQNNIALSLLACNHS